MNMLVSVWFRSYLKNGDGRPEDIVEVLPIALAPLVLLDDHLTRALFTYAIVADVLAKLTPKQVHAKDAVRMDKNKKHLFGWFPQIKTKRKETQRNEITHTF